LGIAAGVQAGESAQPVLADSESPGLDVADLRRAGVQELGGAPVRYTGSLAQLP
jgi:hypothetical protein